MTEVNGVSFHFPRVFQGRGDTGVGGENKERLERVKKRNCWGCVGGGMRVEISVSNQKFPANWMSDFINDEIYKGP